MISPSSDPHPELEYLNAWEDIDKWRLNQLNDMRQTFLDWALSIATWLLILTALIMLIQQIASHGKLDPAVLITFITALVVDFLGILVIIAKHLYSTPEAMIQNQLQNSIESDN